MMRESGSATHRERECRALSLSCVSNNRNSGYTDEHFVESRVNDSLLACTVQPVPVFGKIRDPLCLFIYNQLFVMFVWQTFFWTEKQTTGGSMSCSCHHATHTHASKKPKADRRRVSHDEAGFEHAAAAAAEEEEEEEKHGPARVGR